MTMYKGKNEMFPIVQSCCNPQEEKLKNKDTKQKSKDKKRQGLPSILKEKNKKTGKKEMKHQTSPILPVIDLRVQFHASCEVGVKTDNDNDSTKEKLPNIDEKCPNYLQIEVGGKKGGKVECTMDKNYKMQRELAFERHSQNITRAKYSYFKPILSPQPTSRQRLKHEKRDKKLEESLYVEKKYEKTIDNCTSCLEAQGDYKNVKDKLHNIQREFVKRHKMKSISSTNPFSL